MVLELARIFDNEGSRLPFDYVVKTDGSGIPADARFPSGIAAKGVVENHCGMVTLTGTVDFAYRAPCDRCAAEVVRAYSIPLSHQLIRQLHSDETDEYIAVENSSLPLDDLIYEDAILALPMRFLCREDCKGLCPICGADRNEGDCGCKKPSDPRLAVLEQLLNE